ncbi:MFS transporter [Schlegelella sp. S2-27]|uniref:MFS transporter n=1 Tax=Caldimonas mangrovi TaxID=2944811 RepID=A0ABT0YNJ9_9BURK|nr:MFS transporter [Caldimonas mangrovi]MCM5679741.1 MFS transporter [Caldimonas mangrovi]
MTRTTPPDGDRAALFRDRNFLWLLAGGAISMLGDQFTLIALPWLVLQMTGDPLALGLVLGLASLPRALLMLVGGALVDRYAPKRVMMWTKHASSAALLLLAVLLATGQATLWTIGALAFVLGLAMAFSIPAGTSMLPHVVAARHLPAANGVMLGLRQMSFFVGPLLAGGVIVWFGQGASEAAMDTHGLSAAFLFDAFSFALSAWTLSKVRLLGQTAAVTGGHPAVWSSVMQGLRWCWQDRDLRTCFLYWAAISLLITGPLQIALPVLARELPAPGAAAFGLLMGAHGAGTLLGMVFAGARPTARVRNLGTTLLLVDASIGVLVMPLGHIAALWQGLALLMLIGLLGGFVQVAVFTWIQRRVPAAYLGRTMSIFMFIFMGLAPVSASVTGWVMREVTTAQLFLACGGLMLAVVAAALLSSRMRHIADGPGATAAAGR